MLPHTSQLGGLSKDIKGKFLAAHLLKLEQAQTRPLHSNPYASLRPFKPQQHLPKELIPVL